MIMKWKMKRKKNDDESQIIINKEKIQNTLNQNEEKLNSEENNSLIGNQSELKEDVKFKEDKKEKIINDEGEEKEKKEKEKIIEEIKQNLCCFLLRVNIIDDKDIALGYPLKQLKVLGDKIECVPIPEILSYEGNGGMNPIAKWEDREKWWKNRRVEFIVTKKES